MFGKQNSKTFVTKVTGKGGFIYARTMKGSLADFLTIDLKVFELEELEYVLAEYILPEIDEDLKVYRGGNHIRVYKNPEKSAEEGLLFIGDSPIIIDDVPLKAK